MPNGPSRRKGIYRKERRLMISKRFFSPRKARANARKHRQGHVRLIKICQPMALSSFLMKAGICAAFALSCATSVFSQVHFHSNAAEYAIAGHRPGSQEYPNLALNSSGGFLVWQDNVSQGSGLGISALGLDSNFSANGRAFRINQNINGDAERPQVALLKNGGAVFVWQAGRQGFQQIYARFLSSSNVWLTGDVLVNSFSRNFRINPSVVALENG